MTKSRYSFQLFVYFKLEVAGVVLVSEVECDGLIGFVPDEKYDSDSIFGLDKGGPFECEFEGLVFDENEGVLEKGDFVPG